MINKNLTVNLQSLQFLRMKYQSLNSILLYFDLYIFLFFFFLKTRRLLEILLSGGSKRELRNPSTRACSSH